MDSILCTNRHRQIMQQDGLTDRAAWIECLHEAGLARFDKRTGRSVPFGVFIEAKRLLTAWDADRADRLLGG